MGFSWGLSIESVYSTGEGNGYTFQYSYLENSIDRGAWRVQSMGSQSQTCPSD